MRIIAGELKGRVFDSPHSYRTHPMSERIRGALFNALGDVSDLTVLDAFAGSGALGFEALSRGAKHALLLDVDKSAITTIVNNITTLEVGSRAKAIRVDAQAWLRTQPDAVFDLVLLDPPYDVITPKLLTALAERTKPGGVVVLSLPPKEPFILAEGFESLSHKDYGDATLAFYRRTK